MAAATSKKSKKWLTIGMSDGSFMVFSLMVMNAVVNVNGARLRYFLSDRLAAQASRMNTFSAQ
jgi:hypothetical protein